MTVRGKMLVLVFFVLVFGGAALAAATIAPGEADPAMWGKVYPLQYKSFLKTDEMAKTDFGGSVPVSKLDQTPYLKELFAGMPFSVEYKEDRGHFFAMDDIRGTQRKKPSASCLSCKSADIPGLMQKQGAGFFTQPFDATAAQIKNTIGCLNCHDPATMKLRVTQPAFIAALKKQGKDPAKLSRQELRTAVCAQCHVEYYFKAGTKEVAFPWDKGMTVADVEKFYDEMGFKDWTHPKSGADLIKIQHPETEMFQGSMHAAAGLSCADCHMPRMKEGKTSYTSHWITSPLKHMEDSCTGCHTQSPAELKERVLYTQRRTSDLMNTAGQALVEAIKTLETASQAATVDANLLKEARNLHRKSQVRLDWVAAENSMGFHNPQEALYELGQSIDLARQATGTARRAMGK